MQNYDVVVIGAGPGGYIAAIRAAQLGFRVACIEGNAYDDLKQEPRLGGTCLNVGCIPSKALLASSEHFESMKHANIHGISMDNLQINPQAMVNRKNQIVDKMTKGIEFLFKKNKIEFIKGYAAFVGKQEQSYHLKVTNQKSGDAVDVLGTHIIIATGSKARHLPNIVVDQKLICDNEGALNFNAVPKKLAVIGAGVIGLELGSVWRRLGAEVEVLEASPHFLGACDAALSKEALKLFSKQGLSFNFGVKISQINTENNQVNIQYHNEAGEAKSITADRLIISIGRIPNTDGLNLDAIGLKTDERGCISVNHDNQTAAPNVWAIGDVVPGPMLAHKAEDEGVAVAERIAGQKPHIDFNCVPWVIYTAPEIAWVGQNEQQLKAAGIEYKQGQFPFMANGRALGMANSDGFIKVLACSKTDQILGVHIIGHNASDLIAEAAVAMEFKAASEDIARVCHPHPSLSEVMREACLAVDGRALNM